MIPDLPLTFTDTRLGAAKKYTIKYARPSGGKAGKGHNETSTVQIIYLNFILKHIRFKVGNIDSKKEAVRKAIEYCIGTHEAKKYFE